MGTSSCFVLDSSCQPLLLLPWPRAHRDLQALVLVDLLTPEGEQVVLVLVQGVHLGAILHSLVAVLSSKVALIKEVLSRTRGTFPWSRWSIPRKSLCSSH